MDLLLAKNLSQRSYILSGKKAFFYRFCDTGFKNKWTGLWAMPCKFLEYYAFRINNEWLSPKNCTSFESSESYSIHHFDLNSISAKEFLFLPEGAKALVCILTLQNLTNEKEEVSLSLEVAINIREREENWHERTYTVKNLEGKTIANSEKGSLIFGSFPSGKIELTQEYREHYPSGEKQRYFIPGTYSIDLVLNAGSREDLIFVFSCGKSENEANLYYESAFKSLISSLVEKEKRYSSLNLDSKLNTGIDYLDELFRQSVISTEKLAHNSDFGFGYFAGFPWFTQIWGRDSGWILPAVIDYGDFESAKNALITLARFHSDGCIPNTIYMNGKTDYNSADATLLWIIALNHYVKNSGDIQLLNEVKEVLVKAVDWCRQKDKDRDGFIEAIGKETWMDTLDRTGKPIEIQVFLTEALKSAGNLFQILGDSNRARMVKEHAMDIERKFERRFWNEKDQFYFDRIDGSDATKTINSIFPLLFGLSQNSKQVLDRIESEEFSSPFGVRTVSRNGLVYNPAGYHNGSTWGWITALAACAEFKNSRPEKGIYYLGILSDSLNKSCVGAIGEAWNSEDGSLILTKENLREEGACLQGWSSALVVRCIDEYMLGIRVDALSNTITVSPSLFDGMKVVRRKRIGDDFVDLMLERSENRLSVRYKSMNDKEYRIIQTPKF